MIKHARNLLEEMWEITGHLGRLGKPADLRASLWAQGKERGLHEACWITIQSQASPAKPLGVLKPKSAQRRLCLPGTSFPLVFLPCSVLTWKKPLGGMSLAQIQQEISKSSSQSLQTVPPSLWRSKELHHDRLIRCLLMPTEKCRGWFAVSFARFILASWFSPSHIIYFSSKWDFNNLNVDKTENQFSNTVGHFWLC